MTYGTGTAPLWGKQGESLSSPHQQQQSGSNLSNRFQTGSPSYQNPSGGSYQPPNVGNNAQDQAQVLADTVKSQYEAEATAAQVMSQMTTQRYQLQNAHENVYNVRDTTEQAKQELTELQAKGRRKKRRLQIIAGFLATADMILFLRLLLCGGSFFCRS
mmetsp:Transcript_47465/g.55444  ORF Transcript_47465/g.55444 Transcript_47465/m.55444 type:complete len:159 (+) Transcript_47465:83-559(+)|eukprot:CAMPEP_0194391750 /NCGR_PEP_ID=MMETSP0174-20130528/117563_1 /TAXON_ID=216777 /ORGANISM="Proboscia alata, Strain PI-D3" /LENGTH=158 /DNA_ID=CAMNT_0039186437 /DNA_START=84 /DNA_END=560 /DNA_ORIENTATION=-